MLEVVAESIASLRQVVATLDPSVLSGPDAKRLVEDFAAVERLAGAGKTLAAGRLAQTGAWVGDGSHRDVGSWMAAATGTTVGQARQTLETAQRLGGLAATESVFRAGSLSGVQVDAIATAASADPSAESSLLEHASSDGVRGLRAACAAVEAAASRDQAARYEACRARRSLRHRRVSDVEGVLEMRGPLDVTARVMAALAPHEAELFDQARSSERREHPEALAFDALAQMADESAAVAAESNGNRAPATVVAHVDHTAFTRGWTEPGETCQIAGIGAVPVLVVRKLAGDAILKALITDGTDIRSVSHLGRTIPARLRTAIAALYPECVIAGCHVDRHLEIDHNTPVCAGGRTDAENLAPLCHFHHDEKTINDLRVEGTGTHRTLVPAPRPPPEP